MIVEPDFPDHWKTQMLISLSNDQSSPMWVIRLWAHCQQRKTHEFTNFPPEAIKAVCRFVGQASTLESLLRTCGFIRRCDGRLVVHQWDEYNAKLFANWENGKLGGRPKVEPKTKPNDNPTETHGLPNDNPRVTDREEKIDKIEKKDKTIQSSVKRLFTDNWCLEFQKSFGTPYKFEGAKDGKAADSLLALNIPTPEIMQIAKKAWSNQSKFWCKHALTLAGFSSKFNEIRGDLGELKAAKNESVNTWGTIKGEPA